MGGKKDLTLSFIVRTLLGSVVIEGDLSDDVELAACDGDDDDEAPAILPPGSKVRSSFSTFELELASIEGQSQGFAEDAASFDERKKSELRECKVRWGKIGKAAKGPPRRKASSFEVMQNLLFTKVSDEMSIFDAIMLTHGKTIVKFGHPLAPCVIDGTMHKSNTARYTFWPSMMKEIPLLFVAASMIVTAPATSTRNEGFHSIVTLILRPNRRTLSTMNVQTLALMRAAFPEILKKLLPERELTEVMKDETILGYLDVDAVTELLESKLGDLDLICREEIKCDGKEREDGEAAAEASDSQSEAEGSEVEEIDLCLKEPEAGSAGGAE